MIRGQHRPETLGLLDRSDLTLAVVVGGGIIFSLMSALLGLTDLMFSGWSQNAACRLLFRYINSLLKPHL